MFKYAVIPTHNRPTELRDCLASLAGQVDTVVVVDNVSDPPVPEYGYGTDDFPKVVTIYDGEQPPNLSKLWNLGLEEVAQQFDDDTQTYLQAEYYVAILNDDALVPPGWFDHVIATMKATGAAAGCTSEHADAMRLHLGALRSVFDRITGWAFVLDGRAGIQADDELRWWYGDTAIDMRARKRGGLVISPGPIVVNRYPNLSTRGVLAEQAGRDRAVFIDKYGPVPW